VEFLGKMGAEVGWMENLKPEFIVSLADDETIVAVDDHNDDVVVVDVAERLMTMFHPQNKQKCVYENQKKKGEKRVHFQLTAKTPSASGPCKHN